MNERKPDTGDRFVSMVIDQMLMTVVVIAFAVPHAMRMSSYVTHDSFDKTAAEFNLFASPLWYLALLGPALYLSKDIIGGRSLTKRLLRLQLVDHRTGLAANPIRSVLRNLTAVIWPLEVLIALVNPSRRLGDLIAGTRIVIYDEQAVKAPAAAGKLLAALVLAYVIVFALTIPTWRAQAKMRKAENPYVQSSYDSVASLALGSMLADSLHGYMEAKVRIYNKAENDTLKFISCVLEAKDIYYYNAYSQDTVQTIVLNLIYAQYPKQSFIGKAKFIPAENSDQDAVTMPIGRDEIRARETPDEEGP